MDMKYIFVIVFIFVILILNTNTLVSSELSEKFSPIKESYNSLVNKLTNDGNSKMSYETTAERPAGEDSGTFIQPGETSSGRYYITAAGGIQDTPKTLAGSNLSSTVRQNGSSLATGTKSGEYVTASHFYRNPELQPTRAGKTFNDIYSRKKGCDKPGELECVVNNLENAFAIEDYVIDENNRRSDNGALYGGQNPKTLIPPMMSRPMYSMDWRNSSMAVPNIINGTSNENLHLSGYLSKSDISSWDDEDRMKHVELKKNAEGDFIEDFNQARHSEEATIEHYNINNPSAVEYKEKDWSDYVKLSKGYNKGQLQKSGFPSNLPQGNCGQNERMKLYNDMLFTSNVQPGVKYRQNLIEQVNANSGISFQQQFLPRTITEVGDGILVEDHDPESAPELPKIYEKSIPSVDNVYDPRFNGYGDQTRSYVDDVTGQPRYVYDDINNVKMPNYLVRSKLDVFNFADTYGIAEPHGKSLNEMRGDAERAFLDSSIAHRNDLTVKLMRKSNAADWQRRQAPLGPHHR